MSSPLINPVLIDLKVKVPVSSIRAHFSTAIENPYSWFHWTDVQYDKDNNPIKGTLTYWHQGDESRLRKREVTDRDFANGLQSYVRVHGLTVPVQYHGDDDWDIDADGADAIMQYVVYEEILLS